MSKTNSKDDIERLIRENERLQKLCDQKEARIKQLLGQQKKDHDSSA